MPGAYIHAIYTLHSLAEIGYFFFKKEIEFGSLLANICFLHQHIIILIFNVMNVTLNYIQFCHNHHHHYAKIQSCKHATSTRITTMSNIHDSFITVFLSRLQ